VTVQALVHTSVWLQLSAQHWGAICLKLGGMGHSYPDRNIDSNYFRPGRKPREPLRTGWVYTETFVNNSLQVRKLQGGVRVNLIVCTVAGSDLLPQLAISLRIGKEIVRCSSQERGDGFSASDADTVSASEPCSSRVSAHQRGRMGRHFFSGYLTRRDFFHQICHEIVAGCFALEASIGIVS
jgi:hypothetical protein